MASSLKTPLCFFLPSAPERWPATGCKQRSGVGRPPRSTDSIGELSRWQYLPIFSPKDQPRLFALRVGPLDHDDMPEFDALKQEDRGEFVVEPGQLPGELHARCATTTDQPRLWLVIHVRIIGVRECRHGTGNIVRRATVEATSVVGDRARIRWFRRIRSLRTSGRPAQTAAALAGACGQAASHPRIGGTGVPSPGLSEQASNQVSMTDIAWCGEHFRPRRSTAQYCSSSYRKTSARSRAVPTDSRRAVRRPCVPARLQDRPGGVVSKRLGSRYRSLAARRTGRKGLLASPSSTKRPAGRAPEPRTAHCHRRRLGFRFHESSRNIAWAEV